MVAWGCGNGKGTIDTSSMVPGLESLAVMSSLLVWEGYREAGLWDAASVSQPSVTHGTWW